MGGGGTLPSISCRLPPLIHSMTYMGSALSRHAATTTTQLGWRTLALIVSSSMNLLKSRSVREHTLQGSLDGDEHAVQQPLLHAAMSSRLRGKTRVQLHITALDDFQADLGI